MLKVSIGNNLKRRSVLLDAKTSLVDALSAEGIDTNGGVVSLNGAIVRADDLGKSFADFGIADGSEAMLVSVFKADNAASVKIVDHVAVICSDLTLEQIKNLEGFRPSCLALTDEDGNEIFRIGSCGGDGSIDRFGAVFDHEYSGKAAVTIDIPLDIEDVKSHFLKVHGSKIMNLEAIEKQAKTTAEELDTSLRLVESKITLG